MRNENQTEENLPDFYNYYAKKKYWSLEEAVLLSLSVNLEEILSMDEALQDDESKEKEEKLHTEYNRLKELVNEGLFYNIISGNMEPEHIHRNIRLGCYPQAEPLSFINWCKIKHIAFPEELEKLVKKYTPNYVDWKARCEELEFKIEELETKNIKLIQEVNSLPNAKRLNSWQKGFIGMMAVKYGYERLLANFGNIYNKTEIDDKIKLSYAKIRNDFDLQGISLDDEVIKGLIQEAIKYLPHKKK